MSANKVVVTGIGVVSPLAASRREHYARYCAGDSGVVIRDEPFAPRRAVAFDDSMPKAIVNRMLRKLLQRTAVMAVIAAGEAVRDAHLEDDAATLAAMSLYLASVSFDVPQSQFVPALDVSLADDGTFDVTRFATRGIPRVDPLLIVKSLPNAGLCGIAIEHGILGPNLNISSGSSGGMQALAMGARSIALGEADVVMAGAYDSLLQPEHVVAELLAGRTMPPGEGAAVWILESVDHARRRGARPYASVLASHESFDSLEVAAARALDESRRRPRRVFGDSDDPRELAIAHTLLGDGIEIETAGNAIGFTGAASGTFSATHAALAIAGEHVDDALVWHSDERQRNIAIVLGRGHDA